MPKIVFCNVGWMRFYQGEDEITGGGEYVENNEYGHEMYNFQEYQGKVYGYVRVPKTMRIERIGASRGAESVNGVTVIWTANHPDGGTVIVGWYRNATVYRKLQRSEVLLYRRYRDDLCKYIATADYADATLVPVNNRIFVISKGELNGMGQCPFWYGNDDTIKRVQEYISKRNKA